MKPLKALPEEIEFYPVFKWCLVLAPFGGPAKRENKNLRKIYGPDAEKGKGNGAHNAVHYHPKDSDYEDVHIWFGFDPDAILNRKIMFVY